MSDKASSVSNRRPRLLAVASGGGHWIQLMRLRPAFRDFETIYVSTLEGYEHLLGDAPIYLVADSSRFDVRPLLPTMLKALRIFMRHRPKVVVTTGSAPGLPFILIGRLLGCKTLWIDSIANSERLSSSGRIARRLGAKVISQWPDVARSEGVESWGSVV